ncbi:hypothetical protein CB1_031663001 [Camelus ferus]|nr:hypothetical protein CB1_031663001 [Camelus ferus]
MKHSEPLSFAAKVWQRDLCGSSVAPALRSGGGKRPGGKTPLHLACISGCPGVVALLIQFNCDLNARDKERTTALIRDCPTLGLHHRPVISELCVTVLLEHGADPNLVDDRQNTALHYAVLAEDTSIAAKLLRYKANIEAINKV